MEEQTLFQAELAARLVERGGEGEREREMEV